MTEGGDICSSRSDIGQLIFEHLWTASEERLYGKVQVDIMNRDHALLPFHLCHCHKAASNLKIAHKLTVEQENCYSCTASIQKGG